MPRHRIERGLRNVSILDVNIYNLLFSDRAAKKNIPKNGNPMVTVSPRWNPTRRPCPTAGLAENVQGAVSGFCPDCFFNFLYKEGRDNKYIFISKSGREEKQKVAVRYYIDCAAQWFSRIRRAADLAPQQGQWQPALPDALSSWERSSTARAWMNWNI